MPVNGSATIPTTHAIAWYQHRGGWYQHMEDLGTLPSEASGDDKRGFHAKMYHSPSKTMPPMVGARTFAVRRVR
eukprot:1359786-Rhodomonas_salina.1